MATHEDLGDVGRPVRFLEICTTATDRKDGDHVVPASEGVTIVDVVSYRGLTPARSTRYRNPHGQGDRQAGEQPGREARDRELHLHPQGGVRRGQRHLHAHRDGRGESALLAVGVAAWRRSRGWDDEDEGVPDIRRGRVAQVIPDLGQGEKRLPWGTR